MVSKHFLRYSLAVLSVLIFNSTYSQTPTITKNFLTARFNYAKDTSFIKVERLYTDNEVYLKKETYKAFLKMQAAAAKDGIRLKIISGTRSMEDQKYKWELKWNSAEFANISNVSEKAKRLLRWWSMPGTSRHHWGTDMDLNNMKLAYYKTPAGKKLYEWLTKNAPGFGFYQPFNPGRTGGYQEEKWHWSYVPLSRIYIREYIKKITATDIFGFQGFQAAKGIDIIKNWVSAVNPLCK